MLSEFTLKYQMEKYDQIQIQNCEFPEYFQKLMTLKIYDHGEYFYV